MLFPTGGRLPGDGGGSQKDGVSVLPVLWLCDGERRAARLLCSATEGCEEGSGWATVGSCQLDTTHRGVLMRGRRGHKRITNRWRAGHRKRGNGEQHGWGVAVTFGCYFWRYPLLSSGICFGLDLLFLFCLVWVWETHTDTVLVSAWNLLLTILPIQGYDGAGLNQKSCVCFSLKLCA